MSEKIILITGCCGFIGTHITEYFLKNKFKVIGIDNLNSSLYSPKIKLKSIKFLEKYKDFKFYKIDIKNEKKIISIFEKYNLSYVLHLAGQAGVRTSIKNPIMHINDNIKGFITISKLCALNNIKLLFASSSSVYNDRVNKIPFSENEINILPKTIYGLSKYTNELISKIFKNQYNLKYIGLRFFTVYGENSRRDMAVYKFIDLIFKGKKVELFNEGKYKRDFTYINDISKVVLKLIKKEKKWSSIYNIGATNTISTLDLLTKIEKFLNIKSKYVFSNSGIEEPITTHSDKTKLQKVIGKIEFTNIDVGLKNTIKWYLNYKSK
jgi:UDP-glucuronate 4-epimerase